ncbi:hypothetical protein DYH09_35650, partial [bacterium CPR1]|nr:hypothetical protein [bacterium CPR1]
MKSCFWHELARPRAWHRLVSYLLLAAFVLASIPPAWALQSPPPPRERPASEVSRAALEQAMAMAGQSPLAFDPRPAPGLSLPHSVPLERSWFPSLTPRPGSDPAPSVPSRPKERPAERFEPGPDPPDLPEPVLSSRRARRGLARVFSPNEVPPPSSEWARQAHPASRLESISGSRQAFTVDHLVYHGRTYPLQNPGTTRITWDFISPVAEHNATSRNSAGSIQLTYSSTGSDPTDFAARSTTEIRVWDREHPGGKRVLRQTTPAQREELFAYAAIAAHDPGVWTVREDRDGQLTEESFLIAEPPTPSAEWVSRVKGQYLDLGEPLIGYVNDDWLLRSHTYVLPAPDNTVEPDSDQGDEDDPEDFACRHPERQKRFRATWDWRSPDADLNDTARRSYYSVKLAYCTDGESYRLRVKVWDRDDRKGRLVKD